MKALSGTVCGIKMHLDYYTIKMLFKFVIASNFLAMSEQLLLTWAPKGLPHGLLDARHRAGREGGN